MGIVWVSFTTNLKISLKTELTNKAMGRKTITYGDIVVRTKGKQTGNIGKVVGVDNLNARREVKWYSGGTTWVSFNVIELDSIPYEITDSKYKKL